MVMKIETEIDVEAETDETEEGCDGEFSSQEES
jgi:hypothetical protein